MSPFLGKLSRRTREKLVDQIFLAESLTLDLDPEDEEVMIAQIQGLSDQELRARADRLPQPDWAAPLNPAFRPAPPTPAPPPAGPPMLIVVTRGGPDDETVGLKAESRRVQGDPQHAARRVSVGGRSRGPKPSVLPRVVAAMRAIDFATLEAMKEEEMAATFGACRTTCRAARDKLRAELRQLPTDDK